MNADASAQLLTGEISTLRAEGQLPRKSTAVVDLTFGSTAGATSIALPVHQETTRPTVQQTGCSQTIEHHH